MCEINIIEKPLSHIIKYMQVCSFFHILSLSQCLIDQYFLLLYVQRQALCCLNIYISYFYTSNVRHCVVWTLTFIHPTAGIVLFEHIYFLLLYIQRQALCCLNMYISYFYTSNGRYCVVWTYKFCFIRFQSKYFKLTFCSKPLIILTEMKV